MASLAVRTPPATFTPTWRPVAAAKSATAPSMTSATGGVAAGDTFPVEVLMKSAPDSMVSHEARATLSSVASSPVSRMTLRWAGPQASRTARISSATCPYRPARNAPRSITMSTSSAPAATASATSASLTASDARPDGNAVATEATFTVLPASASRATATRSGYMQMAATGGTARSAGSGRRPLAHSPRTLPGVSAPSSVVRSTMLTAVSSAQSLASFLMDRVARAAARWAAPTWSTPGRPCSSWRSAASEVAPSASRAAGLTRPAPGPDTPPAGPATGLALVLSAVTAVPSLASSPLASSPLASSPVPGDPDHSIAGGAGGGESRFDHRVDDLQALIEVRERALHRVDREPFEVGPAVPERLAEQRELRRQAHPAQQRVAGVDGDPEGQLAQQPDRVGLDGRGRAGLHVRRRAHLQRRPAVPHVAGQPAQLGGAVGGNPDVVHDPHAVAEPLGPAPLERLPDGRQPETFPRVDRDVEVLPGHVLERVQVPGRRAARLGAGDVEPDHALVPVPDRDLGDLQRARGGPHRGEQRVHGDAASGAAQPEAFQHRADHLFQGESAGHVQLGGEAHLRVHDPVGGKVLGALGRDPDQRLAGLHDRDRVLERVQVVLQVAAVRAAPQPRLDLAHVLGREPVVSDLTGQVHHRGCAEAAIQVVVQQHLGNGPDLLECGTHGLHCHRRSLPGDLSQAIDDQRQRAGWLVADGHRTVQRGLGPPEAGLVVGQELPQGLPPLAPLPRLAPGHHAPRPARPPPRVWPGTARRPPG